MLFRSVVLLLVTVLLSVLARPQVPESEEEDDGFLIVQPKTCGPDEQLVDGICKPVDEDASSTFLNVAGGASRARACPSNQINIKGRCRVINNKVCY